MLDPLPAALECKVLLDPLPAALECKVLPDPLPAARGFAARPHRGRRGSCERKERVLRRGESDDDCISPRSNLQDYIIWYDCTYAIYIIMAKLGLTSLKFALILLLSDVLPACDWFLSHTPPSLISLHTQDVLPWDHTPPPSPRPGHSCFLSS